MTPREKKTTIKELADVLLSPCGNENVGVVCPDLIAGVVVTMCTFTLLMCTLQAPPRA
jgi:hypothetical protein